MWELKGCECGCKKLKLVEDTDALYAIKCTTCSKSSVWGDDVEDAIRFWNDGTYLDEDGINVCADVDREPVNKKVVSYD